MTLTDEVGLVRVWGRPKYHFVDPGGERTACRFKGWQNSELDPVELGHAAGILAEPDLLCSNCLLYWFHQELGYSADAWVLDASGGSNSEKVEFQRNLVLDRIRAAG